jgi:hypothetical protein
MGVRTGLYHTSGGKVIDLSCSIHALTPADILNSPFISNQYRTHDTNYINKRLFNDTKRRENSFYLSRNVSNYVSMIHVWRNRPDSAGSWKRPWWALVNKVMDFRLHYRRGNQLHDFVLLRHSAAWNNYSLEKKLSVFITNLTTIIDWSHEKLCAAQERYSEFGKSLCTYKRCWKWYPRANIQAWTRLILFPNTLCRSAFGKWLCTYKRCWKWCPRAAMRRLDIGTHTP